ncbi:MAG TPA: type II CAAX endopeptidase family protein, partial [Solirubrobacteraceae bacterium]|nr:type II CAAX endopeptidase family protein [Solirubrobacteraceae bacterium]
GRRAAWARDVQPLRSVPLWTPLAVMLAAFIGAGIVYAILAAAMGAGESGLDEVPGALIGATFAQDVLLIAGALLVLRYAGAAGRAALGLRSTAIGPALGWAAAVFGAFWLANVVILVLFGAPEDQALVEDLRQEESALVLAGYGLLVCLAAPLAEELFFRGFLFPLLSARIGLVWGMVVTGGIFSVVHATGSPAEALFVLFVLGTGLCALAYLTRSILPCIALHALNNAISFSATRDFAWWAFALVVVGSVVVAVALAMVAARRLAPAAAPA